MVREPFKNKLKSLKVAQAHGCVDDVVCDVWCFECWVMLCVMDVGEVKWLIFSRDSDQG